LGLDRRNVGATLLTLGALAVLPLLISVPAWFLGGVPMDVEGALFHPPWQEARPEGIAAPSGTQVDVLRTYPWYRFLHDTARQGDSLLWNPEEAFGGPFLALWQSRVLSPFSLPIYLFPLHVGLCLSIFLKLFVAGFLARHAARCFGLNRHMALAVGLIYQTSAPVFFQMTAPVGDVMPWFPLFLVYAEQLLLGQGRNWALGALLVALMAFGGSPDALLALLLFTILLLLSRALLDWRGFHVHHTAARLTMAWFVGLSVAGVQILPYLEFLGQGHIEDAHGAVASLGEFAALLSPSLIDPVRRAALPEIPLFHPPLVCLFLLPLWVSIRQFMDPRIRRRGEASLAATALLALTPLVAQRLFPGNANIPSAGHFFLPQAFVLALLAATATQRWIVLDAAECKAGLFRLTFLMPLFLGAIFGLSIWTALRRDVPGETIALQLLFPALLALLVLVLIGVTLLRPDIRMLAAALMLLGVVPQCWTFRAAMERTPAERIFPETSFLTSLQEMDLRVGGSEDMAQWPLAGNGIAQAFNPSGLSLDRYRAFRERMDEAPLLIRRAGVQRLLLTRKDIQGPYASIRPNLRIREVYPSGAVLFDDLAAEPRVRVIHAGRTVQRFDPMALRADGLPLVEGIKLPQEDRGGEVGATIVEGESNTEIRVRLENCRVGVLVLADAWYPGWVARVDGDERKVQPVDGIFRGVEVSADTQEVVFFYRPLSYRLGLIGTVLGGLAMLVGLARIFVHNRRQASRYL
jgi:hypothetical protein